MSREEEYNSLVDLMLCLIQAQVGPVNEGYEWVNDSHILAIKMFRHLVSMQCLKSGATVSGPLGVFPCVDHSSIKVVARAAFETYLVFFYIFGNGITEVSRFRHLTWKLGGLTDRQKSFASTNESKEILAQEKALIEKIKEEISSHAEFTALTAEQKKEILRGNWRRGQHWWTLGVSAGFHEIYFKNIYGYLCGYSHSSYISVLQVEQANSLHDQDMLAEAIMGVGLVVMGHFAHSYSALFHGAQEVLEVHSAKDVASKWQFGAEHMAKIYER